MGVRVRPKLRVLPNGVRDSLRLQRIKTVPLSSEIIGLFTGFTNLELASFPKPIDSTMLGNIGEFMSLLEGYTENPNNIPDNISGIGTYSCNHNGANIFVGLSKGTTLTQAKIILGGRLLSYQLATPKNNLSDRIY